MKLDSADDRHDLRWSKNENFKKNISKIEDVLKALEIFSENYHKKFNFSKLAQYLNLSSGEIDDIIILILRFQKLFKTILNQHHLKKSIINHKIYFVLEKELNNRQIPEEIYITSLEKKVLGDFIYIFKHVKRGKGLDLNEANSQFLKNITRLRKNHPYLFRQNGENLVYPSKAGLRIGDLIYSYNRSSKNLKTFKLDCIKVIFEGYG